MSDAEFGRVVALAWASYFTGVNVTSAIWATSWHLQAVLAVVGALCMVYLLSRLIRTPREMVEGDL